MNPAFKSQVLLATALLAFGTLSCKEKNKKKLDVGDFGSYVSGFQSVASQHGMSLTIDDLVVRWGDLANEYENGICEVNGKTTPVVTIDVYAWDEMDENERQALVYHELGHCVLRRLHKNGYMSFGVPLSMMNAYAMDGHVYANNENYYLGELFSTRNQF